LIKGSNPPILKVADFGFAQYLEENNKDKGLKGSPLYMAPEIFLSDQYDAKADLWSIGVILYEAIFGKAPFSSDTLETLVVKIKEDVPVVIPSNRNISLDCRDLLSRCLVRCPEKRIDFPDFFSHPFLDLEHLPDEDSFQKASQLVTRAVTADKDKDYETAVQLYQESLEYFLPIVHYEPDVKKRDKLRSTVSGYQRRCRELRSRASGGGSQTGTRHNQLLGLCRTNSHLMTGLEICIQGEDYLTGGEFDMALDRITAGLGVLVPALQQEPKGPRRDVLKKEVTSWMEAAERLKHQQTLQEEATATTGDDCEEKNSCKIS